MSSTIFYILLGGCASFIVLPLLAWRVARAISLGWFQGKQIQKEIENDGKQTQ